MTNKLKFLSGISYLIHLNEENRRSRLRCSILGHFLVLVLNLEDSIAYFRPQDFPHITEELENSLKIHSLVCCPNKSI